jgi:hypothetical protein
LLKIESRFVIYSSFLQVLVNSDVRLLFCFVQSGSRIRIRITLCSIYFISSLSPLVTEWRAAFISNCQVQFFSQQMAEKLASFQKHMFFSISRRTLQIEKIPLLSKKYVRCFLICIVQKLQIWKHALFFKFSTCFNLLGRKWPINCIFNARNGWAKRIEASCQKSYFAIFWREA